MAKPTNGRLPQGPQRIVALVERSTPNPDRPRLSAELEAQLAELDRKSAACYALMEDISDRIAQLADKIDAEAIVESPIDDNDSLVHHLDDVSMRLATGSESNGSNGQKS